MLKIGTLKGFANSGTLSGLQQNAVAYPRLSLRSNLGLQLANAFGFNCSEISN
jgi:hypothetical protein